MKYDRILPLAEVVKSKSIVLLGPRQTGKSTLIHHLFPEAYYVNLAQSDTYREYSARPELLRQRLPEKKLLVVIDEAQKLPEIFDEAQVLLDRNKSLRIVLTGSSARKLRRGGVNLLPGRVWQRQLFPLISAELGSDRVGDRVMRGSLPGIIDSPHFREDLKNYVGLYLEEEIRAEGLTRGVGSFSRFLTLAAQTNAEQVNYTNLASDVGVSVNTVRSYYQILEDTLIGYLLPVYRKTVTRKAVSIPKFYFFDCGVVNALLNRFDVFPESDVFGKSLEHLIFLELNSFLSYYAKAQPLTYWRSRSKIEVDFVIGDEIAVEVKSREIISAKDEKGLIALGEEVSLRRRIIVCREKEKRISDNGIEIYPVAEFLKELWAGDVL